MQGRSPDSGHIERKIATGAAINFAGTAAKALSQPLLYIMLTRLYGTQAMGLYLLAFSFIEVTGALTTSGFVDGGLMFASRHMHSTEERTRLYSYMRLVLLMSGGIGLVLALLISLLAPAFVHFYYPSHTSLATVLAYLAWGMPLEALTLTALAIPKAKMIMSYEAVVIGLVKPASVALLALVLRHMGFGAEGIAISFVGAFAVSATVSVYLLLRHLDWRELISPIKEIPPGILSFVIPQNLNMALGRLVSSLDVIMLGWFGAAPAQIAFYSLGAQIVRNARQAKLAFSGSYSPVLARYSHEGRTGELNRLFAKVSGWSTALGMASVFAVAYFRQDLLHLFSSSLTGDTTFMLILLVNPFMSVTFGLAGNAIVMAGHSRWNLVNSLTVGGLNFILNLLLIPRFGIIGAATATAAAGATVSIMQIIEARILVGIETPIREVGRWLAVALFILVPPLFLTPQSLPLRLALGVGALAFYGMAWMVLTGHNPLRSRGTAKP